MISLPHALAIAAFALPAVAAAQAANDGALITTAPAVAPPAPSAGEAAAALQIRQRPIQPVRDRFGPEDRGIHGSVSATVGTGGTRALSGFATARPRPGMSVSVAGSYYEGPVYYPGFGPDNAAHLGYPSGYGPGYGSGYRSGFDPFPGEYLGETTETLPPAEETSTPG